MMNCCVRKHLVLGCLLLTISATTGTPVAGACDKKPGTAAEEAVDKVRQDFNAAYNRADAVALSNLATEDAVWMPPGQPPLAGRDAVKARYAAQFKALTPRFELHPGEIQTSCTWAFLRGSYTRTDAPTAGGEPIVHKGKYLMIMRKQQDGGWKIARDIWNSDIRP
ncbi:MAG: SgcJ/EcaC family oxidoreductase [Thermodesulfobacteriota bacterium]|nr:SgcJ/EcaC family oxidoreductase [Thermodesulfobacteriota bacterium]